MTAARAQISSLRTPSNSGAPSRRGMLTTLPPVTAPAPAASVVAGCACGNGVINVNMIVVTTKHVITPLRRLIIFTFYCSSHQIG